MSLTVNWKAADGAAKYRIYRGTKRFNNASLPTDKIETADANTLSHTYDDSVRNTTYWFSISSVDSDGVETFGEPFALGYFPETGVGPNKLLRGDWSFGYFGEVPPTDLFTSNQLQAAIAAKGQTGSNLTTAIAVYHKFIVNGKIIFIPDRYVTYQAAGALNTVLPGNGFTMKLADSMTLENGGWQYIYRLPHASLDTTKYNTNFTPDVSTDDFQSSEAGMLISMFSYTIGANSADLMNTVIDGTDKVIATRMRLLDCGNYTSYIPLAVATSDTAVTTAVINSNGSVSLVGGTWRFWPVLELVL